MKVKITEVHEKELSNLELHEAALAYIHIEYPDNVYEENGFLVCWYDTHGSGCTEKIRAITERDKAFLSIRQELNAVITKKR